MTTGTQKAHHGIDDLPEWFRLQPTNLRQDQVPAGGKELPRPRVAGDPQRARGEAGVFEVGPEVTVRLAGHSAQDSVPAAGVGKNHRRAELGLGQIREWEAHHDCRPWWRCDHASSSSGRFQSSARAASLSSALSGAPTTGRSSKIVTRARRADGRCTGSSRRRLPCASITASTVRIMCLCLCAQCTLSRAAPA